MAFLVDLKRFFLFVVLVGVILTPSFLLRPVSSEVSVYTFEVREGDGFWDIFSRLEEAHLIRSSSMATGLAFIQGQLRALKPGTYELSPHLSTRDILNILEAGSRKEVVVKIPEGASLFEIDALLAEAGVLPPRVLILDHDHLEGRLFPDTYRFFLGASSSEVVTKLLDNFHDRTATLLPRDEDAQQRILIIASLIEKEVPTSTDGRIVAGILEKRLKAGMPLQIDATLCYAQFETRAKEGLSFIPCVGPTARDKEIDSRYNTYRHQGLPPGPIGNPSLWSIQAALTPQESPYWFYINDPKTKETIFAKTLEEHNRNIRQYLR